ncbi:MAG: endonuclease/exonuclease/phosphatase family protein [Phycisphaerales bacterium]|nr:endonuclease/exonuclease/phosphatase family protein [Phycisphaerales bacterium]
MTYNILEGGTGRIDPLCEVIRPAAPDVVVVPEAWDAELFDRLADRLGMDSFRADLPGNDRSGIGLLSRWKIRQAVNLGPLSTAFTRGAISAVVENGDVCLGVVGVHLHPYERDSDEVIRRAELAALWPLLDDMAKMPHFLLGDFNAHHPQQHIDVKAAPSSKQQRIKDNGGRIPRLAITDVLAHGYIDAHAIGRTPAEFEQSFTVAHPAFRVDYIFVPGAMTKQVSQCHVIKSPMTRFASDHLPILADVKLE